MKTSLKIFLSILALCTVIKNQAQPFDYKTDKYLLKRLHYQNSGGEKGVTTFIYDINNQLYKAVWELLDSSRYSINYYTINNGNVVNVSREFSDKMTSEKTFNYNDNGQIINEYFHRSDSVEGTARYEYDTSKKVIKLIADKMNGWFSGELHFSYKNGHRDKAQILIKEKPVGTVHYKYSEDGNLLEEFWDFTGKWTQTFNYEYVKKNCKKWNSSNPLLNMPCFYLINKEDYNYNNETGGPSTFAYDKNGKLLEKIFTRSDGLKTKTNFEYDNGGRLTKSFRQYSDKSKGIFSYHYNSNDQIIEKSFEKPDGYKSYEIFAYDAHGNLRFARYDKMDGWLTGNIIFELDRYDRIKNGKFKADEGFEAQINFDYDKNDLVTKIHWIFSFGKTQTYTFGYKRNVSYN